ncbi:ABC transporter F family member 4-like [Olea europaea var. sylvestris]|uniref:ABC transporter F family member 4-like n=1 Tax=Olea europaea var. sylvestris TaxID=158386 RepID=UPI000C1D8547|nr:ABC transporter F family member 4-like [Olea europaea var. sylvestris]
MVDRTVSVATEASVFFWIESKLWTLEAKHIFDKETVVTLASVEGKMTFYESAATIFCSIEAKVVSLRSIRKSDSTPLRWSWRNTRKRLLLSITLDIKQNTISLRFSYCFNHGKLIRLDVNSWSQKLRIGRYSQHFVDLLIMDETPVQYLLRLHPEQEGLSKQEAVRAKLGKFGLPSHNHLTPIAKLSGGQKARVVFTSISMSKPHILLLDEPTNHLDMQSIDALADALDEFTGGVVLVSHDSRLISRVCDDEERSEIWLGENGTVETFPGSFEEYKEELIKEIRKEVDD